MKKVFSLEFIYSKDNGEVGEYKVEYNKDSEKESLLTDTVHKLMYEASATSIVVKETCVYKVL